VARPSGFTLVEALIALSLLGLLLLVLFSGLHLSLRSSNSARDRLQRTERLRITQDLLRRQLRQARLLDWTDARDVRHPPFRGETNRLEFVSPLHGSSGALYHLRLYRDRQRNRLMLAYRPYYPREIDRIPADATGHALLMEDIGRLRIDYLGSTPVERGRWQDHWQRSDRLPALVRIRLTDGRGRPLPSLVVHPMIDGGLGIQLRRHHANPTRVRP